MTRSFPDSRHLFDPREAADRVAAGAASRAEAMDVDGAFPSADVACLHEAGLLLAPFPPSLGGISLGSDAEHPTLLMDVLVSIGRGSLSLGRLYEGHVNAVKIVARYGDAANLELLQAEVAAGRLGGVWMAEAGQSVRLERCGGAWQLAGSKVLASGAGHIRRPLIAAESDAGSIMIIPLVGETDRADAAGWTTLGMRATATGTVNFSGVRVSENEIVGQPNDYMRSPLFRGGAWRVIATQLGGIEAILELYKGQLAGSRNHRDPLQLARFSDALIAAETARLWVAKACRVAEAPSNDPAAIDAYVDLARNAFERAAMAMMALAQKAIGLRAFVRPNPMERILRDLSTYLRQPALDGSLTSAARYHLDLIEPPA